MPALPLFFNRLPSRETLVVSHAGIVVVALSWLFGGMGPQGDWIAALLAAPALWFLLAELRERRRAADRKGLARLLRWSVPLLLLAVLVVVSALNPSYRVATVNQVELLQPLPFISWLPSSANPAGSLRTLASLGGLHLVGLSLAFCVHSRGALRRLLLVLVVNAVALSVLGTLQRQSGSAGPYFGAVAPANPAWFATFHYYNHWGAFAVLHLSAALALVFYSLRRRPDRGWLHGPGPLLTAAALLLAATAPLSASRSATVLMSALGLAALLAAIRRAFRPGLSRRRALLRSALALAVGLAAIALALFQGGDALAKRYEQSVEDLSQFVTGERGYGRAALYTDTWRMAADAPVFGWGLESYDRVFLRYSTFRPGSDGLMNTYVDAHSDWLQSLAEIGFAGTALLLLAALLPLIETARLSRSGPVSAWLLAGCALLAAYAWVEFPLACPAVVATWWVLFFTAIRTLQLPSAAQGPAAHACSPSSS